MQHAVSDMTPQSRHDGKWITNGMVLKSTMRAATSPTPLGLAPTPP